MQAVDILASLSKDTDLHMKLRPTSAVQSLVNILRSTPVVASPQDQKEKDVVLACKTLSVLINLCNDNASAASLNEQVCAIADVLVPAVVALGLQGCDTNECVVVVVPIFFSLDVRLVTNTASSSIGTGGLRTHSPASAGSSS